MKTTSLVPWFGTNRMTAQNVADKLRGLDWLGIVFAGGMSELAHVACRSIVVNDIHRHVMNLAAEIKRAGKDYYADELCKEPFHPDALAAAQQFCIKVENGEINGAEPLPRQQWAISYFVSCWMGRSAKAGTADEFKGGLSTRWTSSGGDSNTRYRSAVESLEDWQRIMQRCNFSTLDFRDFLAKCKDQTGHGIYADPPFPDAKDKYKHNFATGQLQCDHQDLRDCLSRFTQTRVVIRYYDHPLVRELYPADRWKWHEFAGRKQSNAEAPEVLITNITD